MPFRAKFREFSLPYGTARDTLPGTTGSSGKGQVSTSVDIIHGVYSETSLLTHHGPAPVEELRVGDMVQTFDHGLQPIKSIDTVNFSIFKSPPPPETWPLSIPVGLVKGADYRTLAPKQCLVIESDTAEELFGDPFVIVPGTALEVLPGIERIQPGRHRSLYRVQFEDPQLVLTDRGGVLLFETGSMLDHWQDLTREDDGSLLNYTVLSSDYASELIRHDLQRAGGLSNYLQNNVQHLPLTS